MAALANPNDVSKAFAVSFAKLRFPKELPTVVAICSRLRLLLNQYPALIVCRPAIFVRLSERSQVRFSRGGLNGRLGGEPVMRLPHANSGEFQTRVPSQ